MDSDLSKNYFVFEGCMDADLSKTISFSRAAWMLICLKLFRHRKEDLGLYGF